jgi:hypothetical protein
MSQLSIRLIHCLSSKVFIYSPLINHLCNFHLQVFNSFHFIHPFISFIQVLLMIPIHLSSFVHQFSFQVFSFIYFHQSFQCLLYTIFIHPIFIYVFPLTHLSSSSSFIWLSSLTQASFIFSFTIFFILFFIHLPFIDFFTHILHSSMVLTCSQNNIPATLSETTTIFIHTNYEIMTCHPLFYSVA